MCDNSFSSNNSYSSLKKKDVIVLHALPHTSTQSLDSYI